MKDKIGRKNNTKVVFTLYIKDKDKVYINFVRRYDFSLKQNYFIRF